MKHKTLRNPLRTGTFSLILTMALLLTGCNGDEAAPAGVPDPDGGESPSATEGQPEDSPTTSAPTAPTTTAAQPAPTTTTPPVEADTTQPETSGGDGFPADLDRGIVVHLESRTFVAETGGGCHINPSEPSFYFLSTLSVLPDKYIYANFNFDEEDEIGVMIDLGTPAEQEWIAELTHDTVTIEASVVRGSAVFTRGDGGTESGTFEVRC